MKSINFYHDNQEDSSNEGNFIHISNYKRISFQENFKYNYDLMKEVEKNQLIKFNLEKNKNVNLKKNDSSSINYIRKESCTEELNKSLNADNNYISSINNRLFVSNSFISLGIYYLTDKVKSKTKKIFYDVYYRKIKTGKNNNYIEDLFFNEVSELINYKQSLLDENSRKQKVFAKIAHEFKTPLNSLIGIATSIKDNDKLLSERTKNDLNTMENLSNYLIFLVSDIINYVNLSGFTEIKCQKSLIDIKDVLNFCFEILKSLVSCNRNKQDNILTCLKINDEIGTLLIKSDEIRIKQILLNFISNAVKFTNEGKISLKARKLVKESNTFLKITVADTGIGINKTEEIKLFQDFHVLKNNKNKNPNISNVNNELFSNSPNKLNNSLGSGLGLSICKAIAEKIGIYIDFSSKEKEGSKFSIEIPCIISTPNLEAKSPEHSKNSYKANDGHYMLYGKNTKYSNTSKSLNIDTNLITSNNEKMSIFLNLKKDLKIKPYINKTNFPKIKSLFNDNQSKNSSNLCISYNNDSNACKMNMSQFVPNIRKRKKSLSSQIIIQVSKILTYNIYIFYS